MKRFDSLLYRMYMAVLCVVCCICIHWCIVFTMHVWGVLCIYGLFIYLLSVLFIYGSFYASAVCTIDAGL